MEWNYGHARNFKSIETRTNRTIQNKTGKNGRSNDGTTSCLFRKFFQVRDVWETRVYNFERLIRFTKSVEKNNQRSLSELYQRVDRITPYWRLNATGFSILFFRNTAQNLQPLRKTKKMNLNDMIEMTHARLLVKSQKL